MVEGWHGENYLVLFDEDEISDLSKRYELGIYLPGHEVVGLQGWDDFILRNSLGVLFTVPTVPLSAQYLAPIAQKLDAITPQPDPRFTGKIKWYVKPIVFGDPVSPSNIAWLTLPQHVDAVKWFNNLYRTMSEGDTY